ncbi:MAG: tetratricopeptide repeat protein, partial [Bacteroidota bacterium]
TPVKMKYMNSITEGIISNIYSEGIAGWTGKMLQVSAPYTHGSSGGALINSKGEVIGITCGGNDDELGARANINFAIWVGELNNLIPIDKETVFDIADHYNRIIIRNLGSNDLNNFERVLDYYQKCLEIRNEFFGGEDNTATEILENIGHAHFELKNYDIALSNYNKCVEIIKNNHTINSLAELFIELGGEIAFKIAECYVALQDKENALVYFTYCSDAHKENLGQDDERTQDAVFRVKNLGVELNKINEIPDWMNEKSFQEKYKEKLNKLKI